MLALGDSLTAGYGLPQDQGLVPQLQRWLTEEGFDVTVQNAGVSGDTSAGGLARVGWSLTQEVDLMILALGGNDILRAIPPEVTRANLAGILDVAAEQNIPVLILGQLAPANYGPDYQSRFDAIYPDLAEAYQAGLLRDMIGPVRTALADGTNPAALVQADGLHPTAEGVALMVAQIGPAVAEVLTGLE